MNDGREFGGIPGIKSLGAIRGHRYTVSDGLAGRHVEDIYQDRRGLLWIATADGGVSRFDGTHFDTFSLADGLPHPTVMTIAEDADGRLWFGTLGGGLAAFDERGFQVYTTEHGLSSNEIVGLQPQADGSMRVLTSAGFDRFAEGRCVESTTVIGGQPLGRVYDMTTDSTGTTWLATQDRGVISLDGRHLNSGDESSALQGAWKFVQDVSGHLWIGFRNSSRASVGRYDPLCQQLNLIDVSAYLEKALPMQYRARHIRVDDRGWLWIAGYQHVVMYDGQDWHSFYEHVHGIDPGNTRLTYEDREGNIWMGLWNEGLVFCDPFGSRSYTEADGLPGRVRWLEEDGAGRLWIAAKEGLACLEDDRLRSVEMGHGGWSLEVDCQETLWIGDSESKVFKGATVPQVIAVVGEENYKDIISLCQDQTGRFWVGTRQGTLGWIEEDRFIALEERLSYQLKTMTQDSEGVLWVGVGGTTPALYYKDGNRLRASNLVGGLDAVPYVNALCEYAGTLWVGTIAGLFAVDLHSKQVRRFTMDQGGLTSNDIRSLAVDRRGRLWIGTRGAGVICYDGDTFHGIRLGPSMQENTVEAILCDRRGRLWMGTLAGLIMLLPRRHTPLGIAVRQVVEGRLLKVPQTVSCSEGTTEVMICFQGIRFGIGMEPMYYSHRLVGYGPAEEWSAFTPDTKVSYQDVPVGEYRFEVRTQDQDGSASEVAHLEVRVVSEAPDTRRQRLAHKRQPSVQDISGQSPTMTKLLAQVEPVAKTNMTILLQGETGTGKSLIAREIHVLSQRQKHAFIPLNCGALPIELVESELFGHEKGAFTSAVRRRKGYFEQAHGGTLFLDEVGDLAMETRQVLLHILEEGHLRRIGSEVYTPVDVRVIAATNRDLRKEVEEGRFRADLFYRLSVFILSLPPLRDRREEIPVLVEHFVRQYAQKLKQPVPSLGDGVIEHLQTHSWPGNVRELESLIQQAVVLCRGGGIEVADVPLPTKNEGALVPPSPAIVSPSPAQDEKQRIVAALEATKGRIYGEHGAAQLLGMNPERLRSRMRSHGLQRPKKSS